MKTEIKWFSMLMNGRLEKSKYYQGGARVPARAIVDKLYAQIHRLLSSESLRAKMFVCVDIANLATILAVQYHVSMCGEVSERAGAATAETLKMRKVGGDESTNTND